MKRIALFTLLLFTPARGTSTASPAIQWAYIQPIATVTIPTASEYLTRYGIAVQVYSDSPDVRAYIVTVRYLVDGVVSQQTQVIMRGDPAAWSPVVFWTGRQVQVLGVRAEGACVTESSEAQ